MFRTPIDLTPVEPALSVQQQFLAMGSCFADVIGHRMQDNKFQINVNPFGVLYHPEAIFKCLEMAVKQELPGEDSYLQRQEVYYNYNFHSDLADVSKEALATQVRQLLQHTKDWLNQTDCLILTFGSAYSYQLLANQSTVANCHKMPAGLFKKQRSTMQSLVQAYGRCMEVLNISRVIISVSPVRHIREGLINNNLSKSILRVACQEMADNHSNTEYFPGYEILVDDLRDYRFYEKDLIHTNEVAQDYVWDLFKKYYLDRSTQDFLEQWEKVSRNLRHRPFRPDSDAYQDFLKSTLKQLNQLPEYIDTSLEVQKIKQQLP